MVPEDYLVLSSQLSVFLYVCLHMIMFLTVCLSEAGQVQVMVPTDDLLLR